MAIKVRVDEKMVKGQLLDQWTSAIRGDCFMVANDKVANDKLTSATILMTAPSSIRTVLKNMDDALRIINDPRAEKMNVFVLVNSLKDAQKLAATGKVSSVNVTRYSSKGEGEKKEVVENCVRLTAEDIDVLKKIEEWGVEVYCKLIPDREKVKLY